MKSVRVQVTNTLLYFLYGLAACNSVEVKQNEEGQYEYSFISRDELAFMRCCEEIGCMLKSTSGALTLKTVCTQPFYELLYHEAIRLFCFLLDSVLPREAGSSCSEFSTLHA